MSKEGGVFVVLRIEEYEHVEGSRNGANIQGEMVAKRETEFDWGHTPEGYESVWAQGHKCKE